jgi:hypothetical protein
MRVVRLSDYPFAEREDRWEVIPVWKGCKDDDQSSVLVPLNDRSSSCQHSPGANHGTCSRTRRAQKGQATSMCDKAGLDVNLIKAGHALDL